METRRERLQEANIGESGSKHASFFPSLVYIIQLTCFIEAGIPKKGNITMVFAIYGTFLLFQFSK